MARSMSLEADPAWHQQADCRDSDPDLFFPIGTTGPALEQIASAKKICRECIAQVACLEYALGTNEQYGIWGGATEEERRAILNRSKPRVAK